MWTTWSQVMLIRKLMMILKWLKEYILPMKSERSKPCKGIVTTIWQWCWITRVQECFEWIWPSTFSCWRSMICLQQSLKGREPSHGLISCLLLVQSPVSWTTSERKFSTRLSWTKACSFASALGKIFSPALPFLLLALRIPPRMIGRSSSNTGIPESNSKSGGHKQKPTTPKQ